MPTILDIYAKTPPKTGKANEKGVDTTPIGTDNPRGEMKPSKDLSKDEKKLFKARGGVLKTQKYSDSVKK
jgi:hypothetical protein